MVMVLAVASNTATTASLTATGLAADGTIELQYSSDPDFAFAVSPVVVALPRSSPIAMAGLNQDATYYVRARPRRVSGVAEDWSNTVGFRTALAAAPSLTPTAVMIQPATIMAPNRVLGWVGLSEVAGFPAQNLGLDAPVAYKSYAASGAHVIEARMAPEPVDTIAMLMTNLPEDATVVIKAGADQANVRGGSPAFSTASLPFRASANLPGRPGYHGLFRFAQQRLPYWRIEISAANLTGKTMHMEHMLFGWNRATKNHSVNRSENGSDAGKLERMRSGVPDRVRGYRGRVASFDISQLTEAQDWSNYQDLSYRLGSTDPAFVVPNTRPGAFLHDNFHYGSLNMKMARPSSLRTTRSFTVESILP